MKNHRFSVLKPEMLVCMGLALSPVAQAQLALEEVIVTSQKREQSAQDVPVALTAISADTIEKLGISQTQDLARLAPSLTVGEGDNKQNSSFRLRGVGTDVFSVGVEQSVAFIIDDVSAVQAGQAMAGLMDIERVEILRGPQSTLFGKSASAGVISVTTKAPAEEFEGSIEISATSDEEQRVQGSISGPLTDNLAYRLSGFWTDREGFIENLSTGEDVNAADSSGFRAKLQWDISDSITATLGAYTTEEDDTCCALTWRSLDPAALVFGFVPGDIDEGITPSDTNLQFRSEDGPVEHTETDGVNLKLEIGLGEFTLTSITAFDNWEFSNDGDVDFSNVDVFGFFTGGALTGGFFSESATETEYMSQELRLASPSYDNFEYLVGLYYADVETDRTFLRNPGLPIIPSDWAGTVGTESMALFGQATFKFSDATSLTAGLRYNHEEITVQFTDNLLAPPSDVRATNDDDVVVGKLSLQHFLADEVMLFASYSRGYKGQAFDMTSGFTQVKADSPVAPETSDSFEIGIKSKLFDNRLLLNAVAFYTEYQDYQAQSTTVLPDGSLVVNINNVGELETSGLELEGVALINENLTISLNAAFIDATVKEFLAANCYPRQTEALGCDVRDGLGALTNQQNIIDGELPNSPDAKISLIADYQTDLTNLPFYGFANLSYVWQDSVNFSLTQNPLTRHDSYGVANISIGINDNDDRYRVTVFVNNLTDENYSSGIGDLGVLYGQRVAITNNFSRASQRHAGVRLKVSF
ncbi:MAG: TonB-dependent receptor [Pseudomonadales bacterium]